MSELPKELEDQILLEHLIFEGTYENYEEIQELMFKFPKFYLQHLITFAGYFRYFDYKFLGDLFELTGKPQMFFRCTNFSCYLFARNLISLEDFRSKQITNNDYLKPIEEYEQINKDSFNYFIKNDDVSGFINFASNHNFSIEEKHILADDQNKDFLLHLACFSGAVNIFKYMIVNDVAIDDEVVYYAVQGGSEEIMELLQSKGYSFDCKLQVAIQSHRNNIAKWIYENYKDQYFKLPNCLDYFNTEMLFYFLDDLHWNINSTDFQRKTCLHKSVIYEEFALTKLLLQKGIRTDLRDTVYKTAFDYCQTDEIKSLFQQLNNDDDKNEKDS